jgi:hypothetical protein
MRRFFDHDPEQNLAPQTSIKISAHQDRPSWWIEERKLGAAMVCSTSPRSMPRSTSAANAWNVQRFGFTQTSLSAP